MIKLKIRRECQWFWKIRMFSIYIDGTKAGEIKDGQTTNLDLPDGEHKIQIKIDWCESQTVMVGGEVGENSLTCGSDYRPIDLLFLPLFLYKSYKGSRFVYLRNETKDS